MMLPLFLLLWIDIALTIQQPISEWLSYPIHDLHDQIISNSIESLSTSGIFHIEAFLSGYGLSMLQQKMKFIQHKRNRKERTKNVFQDAGDLNHFPSDQHPRNHKETYSIGIIGKSGLSEEFAELYHYKPLLSFLRQILINTHHANNDTLDCRTYSNLYLSAAEAGSIYANIAQDHDHGAWHFDQHPFSCVWFIFKPMSGGQLNFRHIAEIDDVNEWGLQQKADL